MGKFCRAFFLGVRCPLTPRLDMTEESDRENQIKNSHFSANSKLMKLSMNAWNYLQAGFGKESGSVAI